MTKSRWLPLALFLLPASLTALIGGIAAAAGASPWYALLAKPAWTPPDWLFALAWAPVYVLMAVAAWRVWREADSPIAAGQTFRLYGAQLGLNALWFILFFALHRPGWALIAAVSHWLLLLRLLLRFRGADRIATRLWVVYMLWVSFVAVFDAAILDLNR